MIDCIIKVKPAGTRTTAGEASQAETHAVLKASVSSATPSPTAPNDLTLKMLSENGEGAGETEGERSSGM